MAASEIEAALVQVPQGEEIGGRHQGVVDGMEGLPRGIRGTGHVERGPVPGLPPGGDGRTSSALIVSAVVWTRSRRLLAIAFSTSRKVITSIRWSISRSGR